MKKILIIQTASIGDVILITPMLEALHKHQPELRTDLLIRKGFESLFEKHPFLNEVLTWDKKGNKYADLHRLLHQIRNNRYNVVVNVQRFASTGFLTLLSGAKTTIGFDKNPFSRLFSQRIKHAIGPETAQVHEADRNLKLLENLIGVHKALPRLYPSATQTEKVKAYQSKTYYCLAPASLWLTKQFPEARWVELINKIPYDQNIFLLGAETDYQLCERIISQVAHPSVTNLAGKLSLLESAALMQKATMNFVNDSAPMHLASAVNANTTAIYCSTIPAFGFGPLSENSVVVETSEKLSCRPCGLHGFQQCPETHFNCANTIPLQSLIDRL